MMLRNVHRNTLSMLGLVTQAVLVPTSLRTTSTLLAAALSTSSGSINNNNSSRSSSSISIDGSGNIETLSSIQNIVIAGGTHGNEYTGVWCIQHIEEQMEMLNTKYPNLHIKSLLANPEAFHQNRRFVDTDLNREFTMDQLRTSSVPDGNGSSRNTIVETRRAQEINAQYGPKDNPQTDLIIDLHSTTSNMGVTLIVSESDHRMAQVAAYVLQQFQSLQQEPKGYTNTESVPHRDVCDHKVRALGRQRPELQCHILMHAIPDRLQRPNLSSVARHGLTIEVGPVPQGVLRHDAVQHTLTALYHVLDFLQQHSTRSNSDHLAELERYYPDNCVPCFRSAKAVAKGELSGKIPWPSHESNPNFPAFLIHENLQDRDFERVKKGDPLFVDKHGAVIPYSGSHGDEVYLMFINEGGYYYQESGTGVGVAVRSSYHLHTGNFITSCDWSISREHGIPYE